MSVGYRNNFDEIRPIGNQSATTIFEARSLHDNRVYAIKKIPFNIKDESAIVNEIKTLSKLDHNYVIHFIDIWVQNNYYLSTSSRFYANVSNILLSPDKTRLMHIQMNFCLLPLDKVIKLLNYSNANVISPKKYSIASEIFLQLLDCINYLHENSPPIIHKNLKTENIMLIEDCGNRNVRLTDFGLSCYYDVVNEWHSTRKGIKSNCPPEVNRISYTYKTDMYCLGVVMKELFNIDVEKKFPISKSKIQSQYGIIRNICLKCLSPTATGRPSCEEILNSKDKWVYSIPKTKNLLSEINKLEVKTKVKDEANGEIIGGSAPISEKQKLSNRHEDKNVNKDDIGLPYNFRHILHIGHNLNNPNATVNVNNMNDREKLSELYAEKLAQQTTDETPNDVETIKSLPIQEQLFEEDLTKTVFTTFPRKSITSNVDSENLVDDDNEFGNDNDLIKDGLNENYFETNSQSSNLNSNEKESAEEYRIETPKLEQTIISAISGENTEICAIPNTKNLYCKINKIDIKNMDMDEEIERTKENEKFNAKPLDGKAKSADISVSSPFDFVHILHIGHDSNNNSEPLMSAIYCLNEKEKLNEIYLEKLAHENKQSVSDQTIEENNDIVSVTKEIQDCPVNETAILADEAEIRLIPMPRKTITSKVLEIEAEKLTDDDKQAVIESTAIKREDSVEDPIFRSNSQLGSQSNVDRISKPEPPPIAPRSRNSKVTSVKVVF